MINYISKNPLYSRGLFAEGALKGAEYIVNKENGYYTMDDII